MNHRPDITPARATGKKYCRVTSIMVDSVQTSGVVSLSFVTASGTREVHGGLTWGDTNVMWVYCPSTMTSSANHPNPGSPPAVGTTGMLYIEEAWLAARPNIVAGPPKWPDMLPMADGPVVTGKLRIAPTSILVSGHELVSGAPFHATVDLMDRKLAPEQTITIGDGAITLELGELGFAEFMLSPDSPVAKPSPPSRRSRIRKVRSR